jgi:hypothetical protein
MSEFEVDLGDGRTVVVDAPDAAQAANAARTFLAREKGSKPQGRSDAAANAFGQGATLGFGDEIAAGVRSAAPGFSNWMMSGPALQRDASIGGSPTPQTVSNAPTQDQRYAEELARQRGQTQADAKAYPVMTTGANVAGTLATAGALSMLPGGQALLGGGATSLPGAMLRGAASGAALGGVQGFGEGEGGFDKRLKSAGTGAAVGGVVGGVLPAAGSMAGYAYEKAAPGVLNKLADFGERFVPRGKALPLSAAAPEGGNVAQDSWITSMVDTARNSAGKTTDDAALRRLALEVDRSGGVNQIRDRVTDLGESAFIADASRGTRRLAELGAMLPGEAGEKYTAAFGARNAQTGPRFLGAMGDQAKVPSVYDTQKFLQAYKTQTGSELYDPVLRSGKFNVSSEMEDLLKVPAIRKTMDQIIADAEENGIQLGAAEAAHMVKRMLNKNTQAAFQSGKAVNQSFVDDIGGRWEKALWDANPAIKAADEAYAPVASLYNKRTGEGWLKRGQDFMKSGQGEAAVNVSPAALADDLPKADLRQLQAFRVGSSNVMRDAATSGPDATRRLAKSIADNQITQQKLVEIYGPEVADRLVKQSGTERLFQETRGRVLAGSPTAERLASAADDAALSIPQGGSSSPISLVQAALDAYAKARQPSEAVRSKLADLLANPDPRINAETLSLIDAILKQQSAARPVNAGIAGAAGGSFASPR